MFILLLLLALLSPNDEADRQSVSAAAIPPSWLEHRLVAHAMGGIDGIALTNSYDAFIENYSKGYRVFEVDFRMTRDGWMAALHDWPSYCRRTLGMPISAARRAKPLPMPAFQSLPIDGKYRPLTLTDIVFLLEQYPDVYFITDTKERSIAALEREFRQIAAAAALSPVPGVKERIIPQIYNRQMYRMLEETRTFSSCIYTLYDSRDSEEEVAEFVQRTPKIQAVTMPAYRASPSFVSRLKDAGVKIFVHTVNDPAEYAKFRAMGVDGAYSDFLDPQEEGARS